MIMDVHNGWIKESMDPSWFKTIVIIVHVHSIRSSKSSITLVVDIIDHGMVISDP